MSAARTGEAAGVPNPHGAPGVRPTSFATARPVAVVVVFVAAFVFGMLSLERLPLELMPELTYPTLTVRTLYPGAAPEEVEDDVTRPIEEAVGVLGGLKLLRSVSRAGASDVVLEFSWDRDMGDAAQQVLEKLDRVSLPEAAARPLILHYDPSLDPVLELSLSGVGEAFEGESGLRRLRRVADRQVKRRLEPIPGVAAVRVRGGLEEEVHVELQQERLAAAGISVQTVIDRLRNENVNLAGGMLEEGRTEYLVRTLNEFTSLADVERTVVASIGGRDVRVGDLGTVVRAHREREILTRTDGLESVRIEILKESDANVVDLAARIRAAVGETDRETLDRALRPPGGGGTASAVPGGIAFRLYRDEGALLSIDADRAVFIRDSVHDVRMTAVIGGLCAIVILFAFLRRFASTAIIAVSIPISLGIAFAPLNLAGISLNIMSLGGIAMGIGLLVDSSIVVLESIFRCREEGDGRIAAAVRGTREVRSAVIASTLTSIAVFAPMVFVEGVAGQAFGDLGLAVVFSLLASAGVALLFVPMLASRRIGIAASRDAGEDPAGGRPAGVFGALASWPGVRRAWADMLRWFRAKGARRLVAWPFAATYGILALALAAILGTVGNVAVVLVAAGATVLGAIGRVIGAAAGLVQRGLARSTSGLPRLVERLYVPLLRGSLTHPGVIVSVTGACLFATWHLARGLESELLPEVHQGEVTVEVALPVGTPLEATDEILAPVERAILEECDGIRSVLLTLGQDAIDARRSDEGEHTARFKILLQGEARTAAGEAAVVARLRERFEAVPGTEVRVTRPVLFTTRPPIEVEIRGDDLVELRRRSEEVRAVMERQPTLADVEVSQRAGAPEVQIVYDRERLVRFGLDIGTVARGVRDEVQGFEATRLDAGDRRVPIVVRLALDDRETIDSVRAIDVFPTWERAIPLAAVADVRLGEGPSEVRRADGNRVAVVSAGLTSGSLSAATARLEAALHDRIDWPATQSFAIRGQSEEWRNSSRSLWMALALAVFLVYVILAAQFESFVQPFVILLTVPLAFLGSLAALRAFDMRLSIVVFLGAILLAGIVVNNAIVLIDYINRLRARGLALREAVVSAGRVRLRPILMTTATTVLGLVPMAVGFGEGAELRTPMAITVIAGLSSSTFLTLVLVPAVYGAVASARDRWFGADEAPDAAAPVPAAGDGLEGVAP